MFTLTETRLEPHAEPLPDALARFVETGRKRGKQIGCFDFVPSNYQVVYAALRTLPTGRFCEWGSGMGIVSGLAAAMGFAAHGVERDARLVAASRELLAEFELPATIEQADIFDTHCVADVYFAYVWPSVICRVEEHFLATAPDNAILLNCHGAEDLRLGMKARQRGEF